MLQELIEILIGLFPEYIDPVFLPIVYAVAVPVFTLVILITVCVLTVSIFRAVWGLLKK